jgi:hypothetical protein
MKTLQSLSSESISFQPSDLFNDIVTQIVAIRADQKLCSTPARSFFNDPKVQELSDIIKKSTGLDIDIIDSADNGPAVYPPQLSGGQILQDPDLAEMGETYDPGFSVQQHSAAVLRALGKPVIKGTIDLKKAQVTGAFCKMKCMMIMPQSMVIGKHRYSPQEVAAIMLHETGHVFTFMEFISRTVTTNQALAGLSRWLDNSVEQGEREVFFAKAADVMALDAEKKKALVQAKTPEALTFVLLDQGIQRSASELGRSIYDVNSAEYLADQFAARMGAGLHLATALDKVYQTYGATRNMQLVSEFAYVGLTLATLGVGLAVTSPVLVFFGVVFTALILLSDKAAEIYDNPAARLTRIRDQYIQQLKDDKLSPKLRERLLDELKAFDEINKDKTYVDKLGVVGAICYVFKPSYRAAHKYELLQKQIERLANNEAFVQAAKLKELV